MHLISCCLNVNTKTKTVLGYLGLETATECIVLIEDCGEQYNMCIHCVGKMRIL